MLTQYLQIGLWSLIRHDIMKSKFILFYLFVLFPTLSFAQIIEKDIIERINKSTFIFEGEVIRADGYWNQNENYIYTSLTIDIKKIFKGNLLCGKVELITEGGEVGDSISLEISHNLYLNKGQKGIFLCRETLKELSAVDYYPENNYQKLETVFNEQGFIKYFEDGINPEVWDYQFSLDSLAQVYNLMELYTQINYVDCYPNRSIFSFNTVVSKNRNEADTVIYNETNAPDCVNNATHELLNLYDTNITCTLQNPEITAWAGHKYFEFDISLSDSLTGIFFYEAVLKFKYDTLTFGSRIRYNNKILVTRSAATADTSTYGNPTPYDSQNDIASISMGVHAPTTPTYFELTETPTPTTHVKIEIQDCAHIGSIDQIVTSTLSYFTTDPHIAPPIYHYDTINNANNLPFDGCGTMFISSIFPYHVRAGTSDTVTITGSGFGASRGTGNIFLKNADDGGQTYLHLDSMDYLDWSDTQIKFIVPSVVDTSNLNNKRATPGSGLVKIINNTGDSISNNYDDIVIDYGVRNAWIHDSSYSKFFVNLTPSDTSSIHGGFIFRPDTSFTSHPNRLICLNSAIASWDCLTTVNFNLGNESNTTDTIQVRDGISRIMFGFCDESVAAKTQQWVSYLRGTCNSAWSKEMDIIFNKNLPYFSDTTSTLNVPADSVDLYNVLLHELGHAHSLTHVIDPTKVMWWKGSLTGIYAPDRRIKLHNDLPAINGGLYVVNKSLQFDTINCNYGLSVMTSGSTNCSVIGIPELDNLVSDLAFYPNPTTSVLNITLNIDMPSVTDISIVDITGRNVFYSSEYTFAGKYEKSIPVNSIMEKGLYLIRLNIGKSTYNGKFIIQ